MSTFKHRQRKMELKNKLHLLRKASQNENARRFYRNNVLSLGGGGGGVMQHKDKTLYERHRSMYLKQQGIETRRDRIEAEIEQSIFGGNRPNDSDTVMDDDRNGSGNNNNDGM